MESEQVEVMEPRMWRRNGWAARVVKNEDDDGWAVEMTRDGDAEPALVAPWTMGRDKKNPKPLDQAAFTTWVKTASEVIRRHEHSARARLHREGTCTLSDGRRVRVTHDIAPDEDDPHAILVITDDKSDEELRRGRASPGMRLTEKNVERYLTTGEG